MLNLYFVPGLFKGSTTTLDGVGQRPTPAERPKSLRTLKSVYDGGGLQISQGSHQTTNSLAQSYHPSYPITNNSHINSNLSQSYHGSQNSQHSLNQTYRNQGNKTSNHYSGHTNQTSQASIADRGSSKTEFEDPWQYRTGREPKDHDRKDSGTNPSSGGLERSVSILSPFDEQVRRKSIYMVYCLVLLRRWNLGATLLSHFNLTEKKLYSEIVMVK